MPPSVLGRITRWPLKLIPRGMIVPVLSGSLRGSRWIVGAGTHGCWLGTYEASKQRAFSRAICHGNVVLDVGANCGFYTLLAARRCGPEGRVFAFEPMASNVCILNQHVVLNRFTNVVVFPLAITAHGGHARFSTQCGSEFGRLDTGGDCVVETASLDELRSCGAIPRPHVIKIDVEGAERDVLQGATRMLHDDRPELFLAVHGTDQLRECTSILEQSDYEMRIESVEDGMYEVFGSPKAHYVQAQ